MILGRTYGRFTASLDLATDESSGLFEVPTNLLQLLPDASGCSLVNDLCASTHAI